MADNYSIVKEVDDTLKEIDSKYGNSYDVWREKDNSSKSDLRMLLQDFDMLGLQTIDPSLPDTVMQKKVIKNCQSLVEMYQRNLEMLNDNELTFHSKENNYRELMKKFNQLKTGNKSLLNKYNELESDNYRLKHENSRLKEMCGEQKIEIKKIKQYHAAKINELQHQVRKLEKENQDLKDMFGQDIGKHISKNDVLANYIKKHKHNEEIYKETIKTLQNNNNKLMEEVVQLRHECAQNLVDKTY